MPGVSVIVPAFNAEASIARTIDSVLAQQYADLELIVCDDGSTDRTADIVSRYTDRRVRLLRQPNAGRSVARNRALAVASGTWIALLDADDWWLPHKLSGDLAIAAACETDTLIYANMYVVNRLGHIHRAMLGNKWTVGHSGHVFPMLLQANFVTTSTITVSRRVVEAVGGFDPEIPRCQDWEWLLRIATRVPFHYRNELIGYYDAHSWGTEEKTIGTGTGALKVFDAIKRREPDHVRAHSQSFARGLGRAHVTLAQAAEGRGAFAEAAAHYANALMQMPGDERLLWSRAMALYQERDWPAATDALEQYIARQPWGALPHFYLGNVCIATGNLCSARQELEQALFILPLEHIMPECVNNLGVVYARLGDRARARGMFEQALQQREYYSDAQWNLLTLDTVEPTELRWTKKKVF